MRRSAYLVGGVALVTVVAGVAVAASASAGTTTYEAEAAVNTLAGGARPVDCRRCSGGRRVTGIGPLGTLTFAGVVAERAGTTRLAVTYTGDRARIAQISVNGAVGTAVRFPGSRGANRPATVRVTVTLRAGDNTLAFGNPAGVAPDIDKIVLTTDGTPPTPVPTATGSQLPPTVAPTLPTSPPASPTTTAPPTSPTAPTPPTGSPSGPPTDPGDPSDPGDPPTTSDPTRPPTTTAPPSGPTTPPASPTTAPPPTGNAAVEAEVVRLVNVERAKAGCAAVAAEDRLQAAARGHSADMAARDYFSHTTPEGKEFATRITEAGYVWRGAGENIAKGYRTPADVMTGWMNSSGHRANILNCGFQDLGVGVAADASGSLLWTQDFATPR